MEITLSPFSLFRQMRQGYRQRVERWMASRLQPGRDFELRNRRLFIMPTAAGMGYVLVMVLLWLTGTNYSNNLILALAFLMAALFVVCIHHTFFNLSGLRIEALRSAPCFRGDEGEIELRLTARHDKESLELFLGDASPVRLDLLEQRQLLVKLFTPGLHRGWYKPPTLTVASRFPLGLIRCWSLLVLDLPILVYPQPVAGEQPQLPAAGQEGELHPQAGAEDFTGLKAFTPGVSPKHIAWKHFAREQGLQVKTYDSYQDQTLWLDWEAMPGLGTEARLSRLCYWVLKFSNMDVLYGVRLPGLVVPPAQGLEHRQQLLRHLALFQSAEPTTKRRWTS